MQASARGLGTGCDILDRETLSVCYPAYERGIRWCCVVWGGKVVLCIGMHYM